MSPSVVIHGVTSSPSILYKMLESIDLKGYHLLLYCCDIKFVVIISKHTI